MFKVNYFSPIFWDNLKNKYLHKKCADVSSKNIGEITGMELVYHAMCFTPELEFIVKFEDGATKRFSKTTEFEILESESENEE